MSTLSPERVVDAPAVGVIVFDASGTCVDCNPAAEEILGSTRVGLVGWSRRRDARPFRTSRGEIPHDVCPLDAASPGARDRSDVIRYEDQSGNPRWLSVEAHAITADGPLNGGTVASFVDVTERMIAIARDAFTPWTAAWDLLPCAVVALNPNGVIAYSNASATALFGREGRPLVGEHVWRLVPAHRADEAEMVRRILRSGKGWAGTFFLRDGGRYLEVSTTIAPLRVGGELIGFVGAFNPLEGPIRASALSAAGGTSSMLAEHLHTVARPQELEVLRLLAAGLTNKEIAARVAFSPYTVRDIVSDLMSRLRAKNRAELAAIAAVALERPR